MAKRVETRIFKIIHLEILNIETVRRNDFVI
ncbi:hypothetical protein CLNEO_11470 [Anaerotignum neopropionicum]|uniref:Uncharacterized protein n=1 Tax=Anaerotignum neopropionicum TaxID=36847 RepID=A0A136WF55_9FIRM|nr:hypothetical protein CLNEO_11470 [Anaerotignum neopropionicum]